MYPLLKVFTPVLVQPLFSKGQILTMDIKEITFTMDKNYELELTLYLSTNLYICTVNPLQLIDTLNVPDYKKSFLC